MRRFEEAITAHQQAGEIYRETGDGYGRAETLENLGGVHADTGQTGLARRALGEAVTLYEAVSADRDAARIRERLAVLDA